jgi:predicted DNA-binding transcriptional regulator YafY
MPSNLNAILRFRVLDRCLRSKEKVYHLADLIHAVNKELALTGDHRNVSERTIYDDLKFMKDDVEGFNAPINRTNELGYHYEHDKFSIFNITLGKSDLEVLKDVLGTLKQISGKEQFKGMDSVISRLEETYNITNTSSTEPVMVFEHSLNEAGQQWVSTIYDSIKSKEALQVKYQPFEKEGYVVIISPYILKEYNNRWFLIGQDHKREQITNLSLDRIKEVTKSLQPFHVSDIFKITDYLKDIIGVSKEPSKVKETITIKVYGKQRNYIKTKPIHISQQILEESDESMMIAIEVIPNFEMEAVILGFGEHVEVIGPEWLREKVGKRCEGMVGRYERDATNIRL